MAYYSSQPPPLPKIEASQSVSIPKNAQRARREITTLQAVEEPEKQNFPTLCSSEDTLLRLGHLLQSFHCGRVPIDLLTRACGPKMTWSSAGEVVEKHPGEREVPEWLVDFYQANKPWLRDLGQEPPNRTFKIISDNNIRYLQARGDGSPISGHEQHSPLVNERKLAHVRIAMALHAFPSINSEIIGEEMVDRLMDTAKTSVLPLLSSLTEADIQDWLLPERLDEREQFLYSLFEFTYQAIHALGVDHPSIPLGLPRRILKVISGSTLENSIILYKVMAEALGTLSFQVSKPQLLNMLPTLAHTDIRTNAMILYTLSMLLPDDTILAGTGAVTERLSDALPNWRALSPTDRSTMEFLTETHRHCTASSFRNISNMTKLSCS
ncbi:uncharacterized protein FFE2_00127 [Fusarium fujikuroi]|nr:uncharacterized protein FFE2_00127 [Fusarium fujikuroi]